MKLLSSQWYMYILFLELWEVPVRKTSKIVGALLVGSRSCVPFLHVETNSHSKLLPNYLLNLFSLCSNYSHFAQAHVPYLSPTISPAQF